MRDRPGGFRPGADPGTGVAGLCAGRIRQADRGADKLTPERALELTDTEFAALGLAVRRPGTSAICRVRLDKSLRIGRLPHLDDDSVREHLMVKESVCGRQTCIC